MRVVVQRVGQASVEVEGRSIAQIGPGLLVLLGVEEADQEEDAQWLASKVARMRIFEDANGLMNLSALELGLEALVVSQFTLHASTRKGNRPSFIRAARPEKAEALYLGFVRQLEAELGKAVPTGQFGAMMRVALVNDGPVTINMDSRARE